jgi:hypothetical protein
MLILFCDRLSEMGGKSDARTDLARDAAAD